jgi:hypothetical protein
MTVHRLHIIGDRQAGKTDAALGYASSLIASGIFVVYYNDNPTMLRQLLHRYQRCHVRPGQVIRIANGDERVEDPSGGRIYLTTSQRVRQWGAAQTIILDEVSPMFDDFSVLCRHPNATHIVRTVL